MVSRFPGLACALPRIATQRAARFKAEVIEAGDRVGRDHEVTAVRPKRKIPLLLWPVVLLWRLATFVATLTGIVMALMLGFVLMVIGLALTSSLVGGVIGIPMFLFGLLLLVRGLY